MKKRLLSLLLALTMALSLATTAHGRQTRIPSRSP